MKKSRLLKSILIFGVFSMVYIFFYYFTTLPKVERVWGQNLVEAKKIYDNFTLGQSFLSRDDGLNGVGVTLGTFQRRNKGTLNFTLYSLEVGRKHKMLVRSVSTSNIEDGAVQNFWFPVIRQSKGKRFLFTLSSRDSSPGNSVAAWLSGEDKYMEGTAYVGGGPVKSDLGFVMYYRQSTRRVMNNFFDGKSPFVSPGNRATFYLVFFPLLFLMSYFLVSVWEFLKSTESMV